VARTINDLKARVILGSMLIRMLEQEDDPRAPAAIERLQAQQRAINTELVARIRARRAERGEPEPETVQVGLQAVRLRGIVG